MTQAYNENGEGPESAVLRWHNEKMTDPDEPAAMAAAAAAAAAEARGGGEAAESISGRGSPKVVRKAPIDLAARTVKGDVKYVDLQKAAATAGGGGRVTSKLTSQSTGKTTIQFGDGGAGGETGEDGEDDEGGEYLDTAGADGSFSPGDAGAAALALAVSVTEEDEDEGEAAAAATKPAAPSSAGGLLGSTATTEARNDAAAGASSASPGFARRTAVKFAQAPVIKRPGGARRKINRQRSKRSDMTTSCIVMSRSATIRGKRGGVRKQMGKLASEAEERAKEATPLQKTIQAERDHTKLVLYLTSVGTVRETKMNCEKIKQILYNLRVNAHIRDISMARQYFEELNERLPGVYPPQLFASGEHMGDFNTIFTMNERGELLKALEPFREKAMVDCTDCGGTGFVVCGWCGGSKKSTPIGHGFQAAGEALALKCTVCNENALERCQNC